MSSSSGHLSVSGVAQITTGGRAVQEENAGRKPISLDRLVDRPFELGRRARRALDGATVQGAYLHVPFCFHKCHYCDFYSIADSQDRQDPFVDRLIREIEAAAARGVFDAGLQTIFVGGGTPTLLTVEQWRRLLRVIHTRLPLAEDGEFTVEANPETMTPQLAGVLRRGGVNRASVGAQSFDVRHLKTLERWHDPCNVGRSVQILRDAGIHNINLDLIFGVPGQTTEDWLRDLDAAIALAPSHISCYGLMYEPNTALTKRMKAGEITPVDDDVEAAMYAATIDRLASAGFEQYEISNWASLNGSNRCRHNLLYWRNKNWWAFGPSASGHVNGLRWKNVPRLGDYLDEASGALPPIADVEVVDAATTAGEQFMLGLRLTDGLTLAEVDRLLSISGERETARRAAIERHHDAGLLEVRDDCLRLTQRGLLLANDVLVDLV